MKKWNLKKLYIGAGALALFVLWTAALHFVDVAAIGPKGTRVGFSSLNGFFHRITGVHMPLYTVTDRLGLIPVFCIMGFGVLGLAQWIKRKSLFKVDFSILVLGVFYIVIMAVYVFFETFIVNYRPVLINGNLEASYPSSTTMLVMCVMPTAAMQFNCRIKNCILKRCVAAVITAFIIFMVIGRLISGVHWFSDIVGGALFSGGLVIMYSTIGEMRMNGNGLTIRLERKEDHAAVENLIREAFWNVYRPGCFEHYLITQLRDAPDFVKELDFVMEKDGRIIGQNVFVKANIKVDDGRNIPILTMGPICITPELKRQGFGKILLDHSIEKAAGMGFGAVCFEGNIGFYGKSGFTFASEFGLRYRGLPEGADASFFLCKELIPGYLSGITGEYGPPEVYLFPPEAAEKFDEKFPKKEKLKLPGQLFD